MRHTGEEFAEEDEELEMAVSRTKGTGKKPDFAGKISTWAAQVFGRYATRNVVNLDAAQTERYLSGADLSIDYSPVIPAVIVNGCGIGLGTGLLKNGVLKNQLPRHSIFPE